MRQVRIAVVDSGVDPHHPGCRSGTIESGCRIDKDGSAHEEASSRDPIGHGTAVAATLLHVCPRAVLVPVRVFDELGNSSLPVLLAALRAVANLRVSVVNCSLGFDDALLATAEDRDELALVMRALVDAGTRVVVPAALPSGRKNALALAVGLDLVVVDGNCRSDAPEQRTIDGGTYWFASPFPPPSVHGMPASKVHGSSLAVARTSGAIARELERTGTST